MIPNEYQSFWDCCKPPHLGYSGTAILTKFSPISVRYGIGVVEHDIEGRVVTLEFPHFYVVSVYVPNVMDSLRRLEYRVFEWDVAFREYCKSLLAHKHVVIGGDMNVAHQEIDIFNPQRNIWSAGFTFYERSSFTQLLNAGFIDSFRDIYPERIKYSWWSNRCKLKNQDGVFIKDKDKGWRLDYVLADENFMLAVEDSEIHNDVIGSDHCPVSIKVNLKRLQEIQNKSKL